MANVTFLTEHAATLDRRIRDGWDRLLTAHAGKSLFYQSPSYFDHLAAANPPARLALAVVDDGSDAPVGIVPLREAATGLPFQLAGHRLAEPSFSSVRVLGGSLLMPDSPRLFECVFGAIADAFPRCSAIRIDGVPTASPLWQFLGRWSTESAHFSLYVPHGARPCHTTEVPATFGEYLSRLKRKRRYNLKRQVRLLQDACDGRLLLRRIQEPADVASLLAASHAIGDSCRMSTDEVTELARRGLLLSYVLIERDRPCAVAFGTIFMGTLLMHSFAHDRKLERHSPGIVLQVMMMRDLIDQRLARRIDYGFGSPKLRLTNTLEQRAVAMLMRRTVRNRSTVAVHASYERTVSLVKRVMLNVAVLLAVPFESLQEMAAMCLAGC
jgi:hypothetical protein